MSFISYQPDNISFVPNSKKYLDINPDKDVISIENGAIIVSKNYCHKSGVYDFDGFLCPESIMLRGEENMPLKTQINISKIPFVNETVLYLGTAYLFQHFGHFLVEGLARTWALLYKKYKNVKVVVSYETNVDMPMFVRKFLNALGVADENILILHKSVRFARVFVPRQAINGDLYMLPIMNKVYDKIANSLTNKKYKTYDKIYLSRSAMNDGRTFGEVSVEKIFAKNGFKIIYPEKLPLEQQITLARNCKEMAGTAGTALHLAAFMKPGNRVIQIKRNSTESDNISTQKLICDLRKLDIVWIYGSVETTQTLHFTKVPQIIGITPYLIKFFDENKFKYTCTDVAFDDKEFARYKRQLHRYNIRKNYKKIVNPFIKLISFFGITRYGRQVIREYLYKRLGLQNI